MITVNYVNGLCRGVDWEDLKNPKQVDNSIIMATSVGLPFRGKPHEMAQDAISHIDWHLVPVIVESWSGCDSQGDYTMKVIFQAARSPF
jgi:hypothetical protein